MGQSEHGNLWVGIGTLTHSIFGVLQYAEGAKFGKKICVIGDSHLDRIKRNIFQKLVSGGKTYFNVIIPDPKDPFTYKLEGCC